MICENCNGTGKVRETMSMVLDKKDIKEYDCPDCDGTGQIMNKCLSDDKWVQGGKSGK